ncbi:MAG TPA: CDP-diacylglycerol--glycerol-3-phosphate 3-phosphatidyltransferase [Rhizomicrobium sp.]|nr:CDP-diacylglycerol--glycerol-3-phosphate 3-phosphatidyltransferase [Rhizomicrobium sp.]
MTRELWTLPNAITGYRFVAGPLCLLLLVYPFAGSIWLVLAAMILAEISDALDGYVARSARQVTKVGKILDPMADGLYRGSVFIAFVVVGWMPMWMLAVILIRDVAVSHLREFAQERQQTLAARTSGKVKAVIQAVAQLSIVGFVALFGGHYPAPFTLLCKTVLTIATLATAYSFVDYTLSVLGPRPATAP